MKKIIRSYFSQYKKLTKEKQFNKKVELNQQIKRFKDLNKIKIVPTSSHSKKILLSGVHVATMAYQYDNHKRNVWEFDPLNYKLVFVEPKK